MNRLRERMKAETDKYQQKFFGSPDDNSQKTGLSPADGRPQDGRNQQHHVDAHACHFEAIHHAQQEANHSSTSAPPTINILSVTELGNVTSQTTHVLRDLGFAGQIGSHILLSYGDTLYASKDGNLSTTPFRGMTSNSVAIATHDPLKVVDTNLNSNGYPDQFAQVRKDWGEDMSTHAVGITNVVETNPQNGEGVVFTLLNHRPDGQDHILGAGVANVKLDFNNHDSSIPTPKATRTSPYIWDGATEPWFGDVGALRTATHIYVYGHKKDNPWVYLARVRVEEVTRVECYEYWHGANQGWSRDRLAGEAIGEEQSVFWQVNQGQVFWSPYFKQYLFVYCDNFWSSTLLLRAAPRPEGPWSDVVNVYKCTPLTEGGNVYAAVPHPYLDLSGKTLVVTFTNHPNCVQAVKVEFE